MPLNNLSNQASIANINSWQTQQVSQPFADIRWFKLISKTQHPFGFQNYRIWNNNICINRDRARTPLSLGE